MKCTRCDRECGMFGHWARKFCMKTGVPVGEHFCCPGLPCEPAAAEARAKADEGSDQ